MPARWYVWLRNTLMKSATVLQPLSSNVRTATTKASCCQAASFATATWVCGGGRRMKGFKAQTHEGERTEHVTGSTEGLAVESRRRASRIGFGATRRSSVCLG